MGEYNGSPAFWVSTTAAMRGDIPLEAVYGDRLVLVAPTRADVDALAQAYVGAISPGAPEAIRTLHDAGVKIILVSGGLREAMLPLADAVGIPANDLHAVSVQFDADGRYTGYDRSSPLARRGGKPEVVAALALPAPSLALGDGITDAELKTVVSMFVAFTGVVRHDRVVHLADRVITRFADLLPLVLT